MARTICIGTQDFEYVRAHNAFYVDKTDFVRDWWMSGDSVTLVCRPRRFGKTLNLDTTRCFLSTEFAGRGEELFSGLGVWRDSAMRALQGTVPVLSMSFARVKQRDLRSALKRVNSLMVDLVGAHSYLLDWDGLANWDRKQLEAVGPDMDAVTCAGVPNLLCGLLYRFWGVKPVVLLDEYDAPMERAWTGGYWDEASDFMRDLMNSTFKTNPALGRGLITGVTRVSRESIFSDLNNLEVVTASSCKYRTAFGFTQPEVDAALSEYGLDGKREEVRRWYDGFTFGGCGSIYNPWSVTKYLESGTIDAYWANTSGNGLVSEVVRHGGVRMKSDFEELMRGGRIEKIIDEQVVFSELATRPNAVWALLLAAGYVTAPGAVPEFPTRTRRALELTNLEVQEAFDRLVEGWFGDSDEEYDDFCRAIVLGDVRTATRCLAEITLFCMSSFDGAGRPAEREPERFYHGLVLGMLSKLRGRWSVESNRESGWGRYDVALVPVDGADGSDPAVILEFKVLDPGKEKTLADTVARAKKQIEDKAYARGLVARGIAEERIRTYGVAFRGREALVG